MRISPIQSRTSRWDENFLTLDLRLRDGIEKNTSSISVIETWSRTFLILSRCLRLNDIFLGLVSKPEIKCHKFSSRLDVRDWIGEILILVSRLKKCFSLCSASNVIFVPKMPTSLFGGHHLGDQCYQIQFASRCFVCHRLKLHKELIRWKLEWLRSQYF